MHGLWVHQMLDANGVDRPNVEIWYLGSPYSDPDPDVQQFRCDVVTLVAGDLMKSGYTIFSPIAMCHPIAIATDLAKDFKFWRDFDLSMIDRLDGLLVLCIDGWSKSVGLQAEIDFALDTECQVKFVTVTGIFVSGKLVDVGTTVHDERPGDQSLSRASL